MLSLDTDVNQIAKIKEKFDKYPPYVIGKGLDAATNYLNNPTFKQSIYPPSQSGQPFIWSSEKQRRYVFANIKLPSTRTYYLASSGTFVADKRYSSLYIYYQNVASYAQWVIGNFTQIIGHKARGWKAVNSIVIDKRNDIMREFDNGTKNAWNEMP